MNIGKDGELNEPKQHWEMVRSDNKFEDTAQWLWEGARDYFKWCDDNPIVTQKVITSGKEVGKLVKLQTIRPYNIKALCIHLGVTMEYFRDVRALDDESSIFYQTVSKILYIIYVQNVEMGAIGEYNPIMISKLLNLDKEELPAAPIKITVVSGLPELATSESELLERLEIERDKLKNDFRKNDI